MSREPKLNPSSPGKPEDGPPIYRQLFRNQPFVCILVGRSVSSLGDACFNVAVIWAVYAQTESTLQTALVQVVWQTSDMLFAPIAGVFADRWDRKRIIVTTSLLAALVVSFLAIIIAILDATPLAAVLGAIFALNALSTFVHPASMSVMPTIVDRKHLSTAAGFSASVSQTAALIGTSLAGASIVVLGTAWTLMIDAGSFLVAAIAAFIARIPRREKQPTSRASGSRFIGELRGGWGVISAHPTIRAFVLLGVMLNAASFTGPLFPAIVHHQLGGGATEYGILEAVGIGGALVGGLCAGRIERRFGVGRLLVGGYFITGCCLIGIAFSSWFLLTLALEGLSVFTLVLTGVALAALMQALVPNEFLGRVSGISRSLMICVIPFGALLGGWLADRIGVVPVFAFAGVWILICSLIAWNNPHIRNAAI
jgi:MFS family permease